MLRSREPRWIKHRRGGTVLIIIKLFFSALASVELFSFLVGMYVKSLHMFVDW